MWAAFLHDVEPGSWIEDSSARIGRYPSEKFLT